MVKRVWLLAPGLVLLLASACGSAAPARLSAPAVTASASAAPTPAAAAPASAAAPPFAPPSEPEAARAIEHIRALASTIGVRETGTPGELRAAEYIRDQLVSAGYQVVLEPFTVDVPQDRSLLFDIPPGANEFGALAITGAPDGETRGRLVFAGLGRASDYTGVDARGAIVLVNRGVTTFREKAEVAQLAGAVGLIVANNQPGRFRGTIAAGSPAITIPVVTASSEDAGVLDAAAATGAVVGVRALRKSEPFQSRNVVARPSAEQSRPCTGLVGAHYDSVARAPGANDNASGTAAMIELARTHRAPGLCFVAFGAEEVGLVGSEAYIAAHGVAGLRFMLNLDVLGVLGGPEVVAVTEDALSRALGDRAARVVADAGLAIPRGAFPPFASSDHASFSRAGVPAVTLTSGDDSQIHTPGDDFAHISADAVATMLKAAAFVLRDLQSGLR